MAAKNEKFENFSITVYDISYTLKGPKWGQNRSISYRFRDICIFKKNYSFFDPCDLFCSITQNRLNEFCSKWLYIRGIWTKFPQKQDGTRIFNRSRVIEYIHFSLKGKLLITWPWYDLENSGFFKISLRPFIWAINH